MRPNEMQTKCEETLERRRMENVNDFESIQF